MTRIFAITLAVFAGSASMVGAQQIGKLPELPAVASPAQEAAMAELGQLLFFDPRLSGDGSTSCADCHDPNFGFGDGAELGRGYPGTKHWRNSQTLVNSAFLTGGLHWDGSVPSLLHQVPGGMGTPFAFNMNVTLAEERLKQIPAYVTQFNDIWQEAPNIDRIAEAIASYERTLISADSPFDRFAAGDARALSPNATRGLALFLGKANCVSCHNGPLSTDEDFHNTSVPANPLFLEDPLVQVTFRTAMRGFGVDPEVYMTLDRDPGVYAATLNEDHMGAFRTPPLRYLKYTAPYMHNGAFYTLEEVVDFYNAGGTDDAFGTKSPLIKPLGLNAQERADLVTFLESMSGTEILVDYPQLPDYAPLNGVGVQVAETPNAAVVSQASQQLVVPDNSGVSSSSAGLVIGSVSGSNPSPSADFARSVLVAPGETLGDIAKREYGDVLKYIAIFEANQDLISDPNNLIPGTRLILPES